MKNLSSTLKISPVFIFALFLSIVFTATSCEKEEFIPAGDTMNTELDIRKKGNNAPGEQPIAQIAIENGFDSLVGALIYVDEELNAGLVELFLNGTDQYTVFAPTNDAFTALNMALGINEISDLPAELVLDVLFYHVVEGRRGANSVVPPVNPRTIETLLGESFSVDSDAMITAIGNTANFIATDISASNGIIHVIDSVILPLD